MVLGVFKNGRRLTGAAVSIIAAGGGETRPHTAIKKRNMERLSDNAFASFVTDENIYISKVRTD